MSASKLISGAFIAASMVFASPALRAEDNPPPKYPPVFAKPPLVAKGACTFTQTDRRNPLKAATIVMKTQPVAGTDMVVEAGSVVADFGGRVKFVIKGGMVKFSEPAEPGPNKGLDAMFQPNPAPPDFLENIQKMAQNSGTINIIEKMTPALQRRCSEAQRKKPALQPK